jgi:hypothetical protein
MNFGSLIEFLLFKSIPKKRINRHIVPAWHSAHGLSLLAQFNSHNGSAGPCQHGHEALARRCGTAAGDAVAARSTLGLHGEHHGDEGKTPGKLAAAVAHQSSRVTASSVVRLAQRCSSMNGGNRQPILQHKGVK